MDDKVYRVMVVEDENLLLQAITLKLSKMGIETVSCTSGKQALDYLENMTETVDAIWLDYYLKDLDGIEFMNKLKQIPAVAEVPVMVVSNSASHDKISGVLGLGAAKYIIKAEHRIDEVVATLEDLIKNTK